MGLNRREEIFDRASLSSLPQSLNHHYYKLLDVVGGKGYKSDKQNSKTSSNMAEPSKDGDDGDDDDDDDDDEGDEEEEDDVRFLIKYEGLWNKFLCFCWKKFHFLRFSWIIRSILRKWNLKKCQI